MEAVVKWYLSSIKGAIRIGRIRKPYNAVIGETFNCVWVVDDAPVTFCAEQVSHHPPVSAFFMENKQKRISLNSSVCIKTIFHGMDIGISLIGNCKKKI